MNETELQFLHDQTLRILEDIGVRLEHDEIVARLLAAGAQPGHKAQEVRFPRRMVQDYLGLAPRTVLLADRRGGVTALQPGSTTAYWTNPGMYIWDGKARREAASADLADVARICDHLENVQGVMGMAVHDVLPQHRDFAGLRIIAENCLKHVRVLCFTAKGMEALAAMKPVFPGNWFSMGFTAHGPLRWTHLALDVFLKSAGHGIPVTINGEPMAGVSGPVTLAGSIAVGNAEILAGIVVNQLLEPGRPVIHNLGLAHVFDMKHATAVTGGPENALFAQAAGDLGRFYGIPSSSWVSTEAVYEDEQAAMEKMFGFHTHAANGVSLIWGMGQLESELTLSPAQLVIDNEMINYSRRYRQGFRMTAEELPFDLIREVGSAGSYLETDHTLSRYRDVLFEPEILNRQPRANCPGPLPDVARARAAAILLADTAPKISSEAAAELRRVERHFAG